MSLDVPQLRTASTYVNNLLLARGLLRNGKAIDFAALGAAASERRGDASKEHDAKKSVRQAELAAEVINLVHDLILRRDRETDQLNAVSETLTDLRSTTSTQAAQLDRVKAQNKDLARQLDAAQSSVRAAHAAFHTAESSAKALKDELIKVKATLAQVRTQCANDVRKRDVQLQKLKTHLSASQRGSNGRIVGPTCTINGGSTVGKGSAQGLLGAAAVDAAGSWGSGLGSGRGADEAPPSLQDAEYSLKQETTEFLTQLSQNLSDENDALIALVRSTLATLRELLNLPHRASTRGGESAEDDLVHIVPTSYATLSADLNFVLGNLKVILTNASFVPIDEVYARDEEIHRLRDGWEKMESRWREAVDMMKGWQTRMMTGGGNVNLEELRLGLGLGDGLQRLSDLQTPLSPNYTNDDQDEGENERDDMATPDLPEDEPSFAAEEENLVIRTRGYADDNLFNAGSSPLSSSSGSAALKETTANIQSVSPQDRSAQPKTRPGQENTAASKISPDVPKQQSIKPPTTLRSTAASKTATPSNPRAAATSRARRPATSSPTARHTPRAPSPPEEPDAPLTVEEKLKHAESEARRVSGSSSADSPSPTPSKKPVIQPIADDAHDQQHALATTAASQAPQHQPAESTKPPAPSPHPPPRIPTPKPSARAATAPRPPRATTTSTATTTKPRASAAAGKGPGPASGTATLPRRTTTTTTTRVPTKPPAPTPTTRKRGDTRARVYADYADYSAGGGGRANARGGGGEREGKGDGEMEVEVEPLVEAAMRRSRRKRKSTLSPEELEELMGLRRRADAGVGGAGGGGEIGTGNTGVAGDAGVSQVEVGAGPVDGDMEREDAAAQV